MFLQITLFWKFFVTWISLILWDRCKKDVRCKRDRCKKDLVWMKLWIIKSELTALQSDIKVTKHHNVWVFQWHFSICKLIFLLQDWHSWQIVRALFNVRALLVTEQDPISFQSTLTAVTIIRDHCLMLLPLFRWYLEMVTRYMLYACLTWHLSLDLNHKHDNTPQTAWYLLPTMSHW